MNHIQTFLSPKGRLGRIKYLAYCILLLAAALFVGAISQQVIFTVGILFFYSLFLIQTIKRLHDINLNGWWVLLVFVPIINLIAGIWVLIKRGTKGANKYL